MDRQIQDKGKLGDLSNFLKKSALLIFFVTLLKQLNFLFKVASSPANLIFYLMMGVMTAVIFISIKKSRRLFKAIQGLLAGSIAAGLIIPMQGAVVTFGFAAALFF